MACRPASADVPEPLQGVVELEEAALGFELGGRLTEILVDEGAAVEAGAVLARIDDGLERSARVARQGEARVAEQQSLAVKAGARGEELRSLSARVAAAKASEDLLVKQVARSRTLLEKQVLAQAELDEVEGQLARAIAEREALEHSLRLLRQGARAEDISVAEARANAAEATLELSDQRLVRHELKAPRAGTVLDVNFEPGEIVAAGTPVLVMADPKRPFVDVFVPQQRIAAVAVGRAARVRVDALPQALPGKVEHIARRTEFTPRYLFSERERPNLVVRVRIRIDDAEQRLRAGVPAFVEIESGSPGR
jgi:HlyD family secretion protein